MTSHGVWLATAGGGGAAHVIVVHGSLDRSAGLLKLSRRLDDRFLVTRYDRRGYGRSRPHHGPFTIGAQVDDLVEVIESTTPGTGVPTVVIGHSYGGNVALAAADRHPHRIDAVVTYETPLSWLEWWGGTAGGDAVAWRHDPEEAAERFMRRLIGDERWERLPASSRDARRAEGFAMVDELTDLRAQPPWHADRIGVPVLCLYGEHGRPHHQRGARELVAMLPDARLAMVEGAHHFGPNTHPDETAELVAAHIAHVTTAS
jgi:pimeloyl-ACP methyl ester carboxylesterase